MIVNIEGLTKAEVLATLYNNSRTQGLGFLQAVDGIMTVDDAEAIISVHGTYFDYLQGRVIKVSLHSDKEFDGRLYDRDLGPGAAQKAIDKLRWSKGGSHEK